MRELETLQEFDEHVAAAGSLSGVAIQGLDLCNRSAPLLELDVKGTTLLGCVVEPDVLRRLHREGAVVFPPFPDLPFRPFRGGLYDPVELFHGYEPGRVESYANALDTRVYEWHRQALARNNVVEQLAQRIHDHAVDDALAEFLATNERHRRVVAIMGGHGMARDETAYRDVARLARALTRRGLVCASGGGPGAMEATNLGAWVAPHADDALDEALEILATAPSFESIPTWLDTAFEVRAAWPREDGTGESLAVPTWHYGHEPPNLFGSHVAKYFANSIREEGLLGIALAGVVFAPGSAGTIQEVFQDAAQNHYSSFGVVSPMVFLGTTYWTTTKAVYPLLQQLAAGHSYADKLAIEDDIDAIVESLVASAGLLGAIDDESGVDEAEV